MEVGRALKASALDAVLIGNAGPALQGAPVTTVDFDFLFRRTPRNLQKLKLFATRLGATVLRPFGRPRDLAVVDVLEKTDGQAKTEAANGRAKRAPRRTAGDSPNMFIQVNWAAVTAFLLGPTTFIFDQTTTPVP